MKALSRALFTGALAAAPLACMPAVMHGPRIDGGLTTGLVASHTAGPRVTRGDYGDMPYAFGPVGVNVGYGWTSDRYESLGVRLGLHVPVPLVIGAQPDIYVQLPRRIVLGLDAGVGVASIPANESVIPYAQLGVLRASGSGLFATYGLMIGPDPSDANYSGRGAGAHVPGMAFQRVNGRTTTRLFVMAEIARKHSQCLGPSSVCGRRDDWAIASGMALEFQHRRNRQ